jgi:hypothetical protein
MDQVKLRCMLEQLILFIKKIFNFLKIENYTYSHWLNTLFFIQPNFYLNNLLNKKKIFVLRPMENLLSRANQQGTKAYNNKKADGPSETIREAASQSNKKKRK